MAQIIIMPKQGLMMEEGHITEWLVKEGGRTEEGSPLFEMETDKLTITMDSTATGTLLKILEPAGNIVPITKPIAVVGEPGEDIAALLSSLSSSGPREDEEKAAGSSNQETPAFTAPQAESGEAQPGRVFISPRAKRRAEEEGLDYTKISGSGPEGLIIDRDIDLSLARKIPVTPLASREAAMRGIDLAAVSGSGPAGKITVGDLCQAGEKEPAAAAFAPEVSRARGTRKEPMSMMRRMICKNMLESKDNNAQAFHRISVDMTEVTALRNLYKKLNKSISFNDIIIRTCARVLQEFPIVNASVEGDHIIYHDYVHIGTAVAVPNGLIVPVIKDADCLSLEKIAAVSSALVDKARSGKLAEEEYHGGTFTVTSLGMFDIDDFVAIINPPESAILSVGKIAKQPVVETNEKGEDVIVIRPVCTFCLSYDHRIIDGAVSAQFLRRLKLYLQSPALLI